MKIGKEIFEECRREIIKMEFLKRNGKSEEELTAQRERINESFANALLSKEYLDKIQNLKHREEELYKEIPYLFDGMPTEPMDVIIYLIEPLCALLTRFGGAELSEKEVDLYQILVDRFREALCEKTTAKLGMDESLNVRCLFECEFLDLVIDYIKDIRFFYDKYQGELIFKHLRMLNNYLHNILCHMIFEEYPFYCCETSEYIQRRMVEDAFVHLQEIIPKSILSKGYEEKDRLLDEKRKGELLSFYGIKLCDMPFANLKNLEKLRRKLNAKIIHNCLYDYDPDRVVMNKKQAVLTYKIMNQNFEKIPHMNDEPKSLFFDESFFELEEGTGSQVAIQSLMDLEAIAQPRIDDALEDGNIKKLQGYRDMCTRLLWKVLVYT
ncbi:MAG: hypothetical protein K6A30_04265 [Lachnospiraceae bacterium]|nr:hypothetical protein [Lachnospiraceae bacterium]